MYMWTLQWYILPWIIVCSTILFLRLIFKLGGVCMASWNHFYLKSWRVLCTCVWFKVPLAEYTVIYARISPSNDGSIEKGFNASIRMEFPKWSTILDGKTANCQSLLLVVTRILTIMYTRYYPPDLTGRWFIASKSRGCTWGITELCGREALWIYAVILYHHHYSLIKLIYMYVWHIDNQNY